MKKAHLRRCARPPHSGVLYDHADPRRFLARLASATFLIGLQRVLRKRVLI
jgi:hypothetical protein